MRLFPSQEKKVLGTPKVCRPIAKNSLKGACVVECYAEDG